MERIRKTFRRLFGRDSASEEDVIISSISQDDKSAQLHPRYLLRLRIENALRNRTQLEEGTPSHQFVSTDPSVAIEEGVEEAVEEALPPLPPPIPNELVFTCPPLNKPFIGRMRLLSQLRRKLVRRPQIVSLVSQDGRRGVGVSALAAQIYYNDGDKFFPDGKYWLDLRGGRAISALRALLHELNVDSGRMHNKLSTLCGLLHEQLEGQRVLLVLDHVEALAPKNVSEVLRQVEKIRLPSPAITIVTSRVRLYPNKDIQVDLLSTQDGLALLRKKLAWKREQEKAEREKAVQLIERVGALPLALEITTQRMLLNTPHQNCTFALAELETVRETPLLQLLFDHKQEQYVTKTFVLSYEVLAAPVKTVFHALGVCAPTGASVMALAYIIDASPHEVDRWLIELALYSLAEYDRERGRTRLHPLLHDYAALLVQKNADQHTNMLIRHQAYFKEQIAGGYEQALNNNEKNETQAALKRIDAEADNVRLAQERAFTQS